MKLTWICLLAGGLAGQSIEDRLEHANCVRFGPKAAKYQQAAIRAQGGQTPPSAAEQMTRAVTRAMAPAIRAVDTTPFDPSKAPTIDRHIFTTMAAAGVVPASVTDDFEFCRRVSLDLTGRVPTTERLLAFVNDQSQDKRSRYVDELMQKPEFFDKWTMFLGDLLKNNAFNSQIRRFNDGVEAFRDFIRGSLQANKPYDKFVSELITATGTNSYQQGELNYLAGGVVQAGPQQDVFDQQAAYISEMFLGMNHVNCILCHNGRGHLDTLSLWGRSATRQQAWGLASYLSRTFTSRTQVVAGQVVPYYWRVEDNTRYRVDYQLNTTTGNRPARAGSTPTATVAPSYLFTGEGPKAGENYRAALARQLTADPQFARATVNYFWAYFFGRGIVDPPDQFDPARLDPDNPPPDPWKLQPSHPALLKELSQEFTAAKFDLRWLMKAIVNSRAYQLSSRYDAAKWNPAWESLFARKLVRRLWAEEVHDALGQTSGIAPSYPNTPYGNLSWAMAFPEPFGTPGARYAGATSFLNGFLRGDRDDEERSGEGSIAQALAMMNDAVVMTRIQSNGPASSLLPRALGLSNSDMVDTLFLAVLSRYPTAAEKTAAVANLNDPVSRNAEGENLLWSLYNKVDFLFNY